MKYSCIPVARQLLSACLNNNIKHIIISPGSRSAPLTLSFGAHPEMTCYSIIDERSAAFFGLGLALQTKETVALICTSGTALLNYYPAVCEAFYSEVPLLVLSADRPSYLIDRGDGQTIRQDGVLAAHCLYSTTLVQDVSHSSQKIARFDPQLLERTQQEVQNTNRLRIEEALHQLKTGRGPVHINVPLEEPLYDKVSGSAEQLQQEFPIEPVGDFPIGEERIGQGMEWSEAKSKLVLVGQMNTAPQIRPEWLNRLLEDPSVVVLTETTSNLNHPQCIDSIDSVIAPVEKREEPSEIFDRMKPDLLITLGGMVVSKKIKKFLRDFPPKEHWHIGRRAMDTFFCLSRQVLQSPDEFFNSSLLTGTPDHSADFRAVWMNLKENFELNRTEYINRISFCDFKAYHHIFKALPDHIDVHLSNSSTIRYGQLFPHKYDWRIFCNRGASGIDGSTSTAIGSAWVSERPTVLITGDLSFFYDSNAFWNSFVQKNLKIVLINNDGGGIFRILPGKDQSDVFERYFETPHGKNAKFHCEQYQWEYQSARNEDELLAVLPTFFRNTDQNALLEVFTPRKLNDKVLLEYFEFLNLELNFL